MDADELKKEEEEQKVKVYDFKRALRFSKDQIRSISRIHENYARLLTTFFSGQLRTYVNINVASVDQIPYEEFIRSIPKMTILNVYSVEPLDGSIILEVNPNIAFTMMDRVLGGQGANKGKAESLTEIESQERDLESYEDISRSLKKTEVEATALLGSANITLNELLHLKGDDVIALNQNIDEPLTFLINQEPKMLVQPGKIHNKTAVQ